jgi:hypothetical protein
MCPFPNGLRDRAVWLYSSLALAPHVVLPSRRTAPLSEGRESVWSVSRLLCLLIVTLQECCAKRHTSSQTVNKQICCTFTASAMVVPLLLLKNTVDSFLCAEFRIVECFSRCSIHCVNATLFPVFGFRLNDYVNKMWRNRKTFLKCYNVALLLAREHFVWRLGVSRNCVWQTSHKDRLYKIYTQGRVPEFYHWLHSNRQFLPLILFTDEATFTRDVVNNTNT